jgi:PEP-CTERM motif
MLRTFLLGFLALILALAFANQASADIMIATPAGLNPGDQFTVILVTKEFFGDTSTAISTYNGDVTNAANTAGVTYNGATLNWLVLGATASTNNATSLLSSTAPVYQLNGSLLASHGTTLLSGNGPDINEYGQLAPNFATLTGLLPTGAALVGATLGSSNFVAQGESGGGPGWLNTGATSQPAADPLFGYVTLTVPAVSTPEPASLTLALMGFSGLGCFQLVRRRRRAASRPAA